MIRSATITPPPNTHPAAQTAHTLDAATRIDFPAVNTQRPGSSHWLDQVVAFFLLIPVMPVIAILIVLVRLTSRGPGIYSQLRTGLNGREFRIFKLRTMTWNCERQTGAVWAKVNDPRVTGLGRILRATHLDELPQLWNVLRGEMALVGPRPERREIIRKLIPYLPDYLDRLQVMPGITGLAQISTHADQTLEDVRLKLAYDLFYIENRSLGLDLRILGCTLLKMLHLNSQRVRAWLFPSIRVHRRFRDFVIHQSNPLVTRSSSLN